MSHLPDFYLRKYDNKIVLKVLNMELSDPSLISFLDIKFLKGKTEVFSWAIDSLD